MEVPGNDAARVALMKDFAEGWKEPFRGLVMSLAEDTAVKELVVEDYLPEHGIGEKGEGRVALVGDAGHAMTICELASDISLRGRDDSAYTSCGASESTSSYGCA